MKKIIRFISAVCCMVLLTGTLAAAAQLEAVMNAYTGPDSVVLFLKDPGREIDHVYVGNDEALGFTTEEPGPFRTIVVLDNSLSIDKKYREEIKEFLTQLAADRNDGDVFTIATFAENLTYLVQESSDYLDIKAQIDSLQFENQDSYFTNVMYTVMSDISSYEDIRYTRVIVIADGVDDEALGYTDDELNKKIQAAKVPVYAIGCPAKGNEENLKKMFALSRMSGGRNYLFTEASVGDILQGIEEDEDIIRVNITPPDKSCDGTARTVRVSFGEDYCTAQVDMPFKAVEETTQEETEAETEPETTEEPETEDADQTESAEETEVMVSDTEDGFFGMPFLAAGIAAALVLVIAIVTGVILAGKKKKADAQKSQIDLSGIGRSRDAVAGLQGGGDDSDGHTRMLKAAGGLQLTLQDLDNPSKTFEYPLRDKLLIGRDRKKCQIVIDYNTYVSSVHCEIVSKGGSLFVRDGGGDVIASTNGTFVNDKRVAPELPLPSGAVLKLGPVRLKVTYR